MDYIQACAYLKEENRKNGMVLGLDTMRVLMEELGNPQNQTAFVHIAGTNGKGSAAAYLEQILFCAGYRTGRYTSPAVFDRREQYRINTEAIEKEAFAGCVEAVASAADAVEKKGHRRPTWFEQETAAAFVWFAERNCEIAVLEAGLGGDTDATNVISSGVCSAVTSISLDHSRILGKTTAEIAGHKAGIIKPGTAAVVLLQGEDVMKVIREKCAQTGCMLTEANPKELKLEAADESGLTVFSPEWGTLHTRQRGLWQIENMAVVLKTVGALEKAGFAVGREAVRAGIEQMRWHGRFEVIKGEPDTVLDGAHNPAGAAALKKSLDVYYPDRKRVFVMGVLADKDYPSVVRILLEGADAFFTVASDSSRALPAEELAAEIRRQRSGVSVYAEASVCRAVEEAQREAGPKGVVVICGSLSFMKDLPVGLRQDPV